MKVGICVGIAAFLACNGAWAVYKCVDGEGRISYQDFVCQAGKQRDVTLLNNTVDMNLRNETQRTLDAWRVDSQYAEAERQQERLAAASRINGEAGRIANYERSENDRRIGNAKAALPGTSLYPHGLPDSRR